MTGPQLPGEILTQIMGYLEPGFFQQNIGRLVISKRWTDYALDVLHENLVITPPVLRKLMLLPPTHPSFALLSKRLKILRIYLYAPADAFETGRNDDDIDGHSHSGNIPSAPAMTVDLGQSSQPSIDPPYGHAGISLVTSGSSYRYPNLPTSAVQRYRHRADQMNEHLQSLFQRLQTASRLTQIELTTETPRIQRSAINRNEYLYTRTLQTICDLTKLTNLNLDLNGTAVKLNDARPRTDGFVHVPAKPEDEIGGHLCSSLCGLLGQLVRVHIRLTQVCWRLFEGEKAVNPHLKELILNMSLESRAPDHVARRDASCCGGVFITHNGARHQLESRLCQVARSLHAPERVRVLYTLDHEDQAAREHGRESLVHAFDALSGRRFQLRNAQNWLDDGDGQVYVTYDVFGLMSMTRRDNTGAAAKFTLD